MEGRDAGWTMKWVVFSAVSLAFFFVTAATFTSLGVVLYTMCADLHWSAAEAGSSFSLLGLACGLSSPLPAIGVKRLGVRPTVVIGALLLAAGCAVAALASGIVVFFGAIILMGCAYSMMAPVAGMYLLPRWFGVHAPRMIAFYFMVGAAGGVLGPVLVNASVHLTGSWRMHWALVAVLSVALAGVCGLGVHDRAGALDDADPSLATPSRAAASSAARYAMKTYPFIATAFAMLAMQTALTVSNGVLVAHVTHIGGTQAFGAYAIGLFGLCGTLAKGVAGLLAERFSPIPMLVSGLILSAAGLMLVGAAHVVSMALAGASLTGAGWGIAWLGANLFLLKRFGASLAPDLVATAILITTGAVIAPFAAGLLADRLGSFGPTFLIVGVLCLVAVFTTLAIRRTERSAAAGQRIATRAALPG